jgi:regulator of replication initiation timing
MFNLFPKKKSVDEIVKDADVIPPWQWQPTQTPSMLQAQNDLIEQFLKENHDLKVENQKLKNDWHEPELCDEKISELKKEVLQLRHLKQENADLMEILAKYRDGYQGSCYACEPVGELNQKLEFRLTAYQKMVEGASETIDKLKKENACLKTKHPMYPIHWGSLDPEIHEKAKALTIEETIDKVKKEVSWEEAASNLALRVAKLEQLLSSKS